MSTVDGVPSGPDFSLIEPADFDTLDANTKKKLERLYQQCYVLLGGSSIDVELEDVDYQFSFETAVRQYRMMSSRSVVQTFGFLTLQPLRQVYVLNSRIDVVQAIYRSRGLFGGIGAGVGSFESFGAATANILLSGGMNPAAATVDLASYDFMLQYQETLDRLFAREIHFVWRNETNTLMITQTPRFKEVVCLKVSVLKSYDELLNDHFARNWLQKYTLGQLKMILGEKYSKFGSLPGAQGGMTLKGEQLKQKGAEETMNLENDILVYADSSEIPLPVRG